MKPERKSASPGVALLIQLKNKQKDKGHSPNSYRNAEGARGPGQNDMEKAMAASNVASIKGEDKYSGGDDSDSEYDPETEKCSIAMDDFMEAFKEGDVKAAVAAMHAFVKLVIVSEEREEMSRPSNDEDDEY